MLLQHSKRCVPPVVSRTTDPAPESLLAAAIPIRPEVQTYPLEEANRALVELKRGPVRGAKVLVMG